MIVCFVFRSLFNRYILRCRVCLISLCRFPVWLSVDTEFEYSINLNSIHNGYSVRLLSNIDTRLQQQYQQQKKEYKQNGTKWSNQIFSYRLFSCLPIRKIPIVVVTFALLSNCQWGSVCFRQTITAYKTLMSTDVVQFSLHNFKLRLHGRSGFCVRYIEFLSLCLLLDLLTFSSLLSLSFECFSLPKKGRLMTLNYGVQMKLRVSVSERERERAGKQEGKFFLTQFGCAHAFLSTERDEKTCSSCRIAREGWQTTSITALT